MVDLLISFLGRVPKGHDGYRTTSYTFNDGTQPPPTAYFGWTLRERLNPKTVLVLGTPGSMWDYLIESMADQLADEFEDERLALVQATEDKCVTQTALDELGPMLSRALGAKVVLQLVPGGADKADQVAVLTSIAEHVRTGDRVALDVTHGLRHLPMLGLVSALHLQVVRKAEMHGIYYGSFDPDTEQSRVYDLSGLLHIAEWVRGLHMFDKDGDYGVLTNLVEDATAGSLLRQAAFAERCTRAGAALGALSKLDLDELSLGPVGNLFKDAIKERIEWRHEARLYQRQRALALAFLDRADYLRATLYAYEAFVTCLVRPPAQPEDFDERDRARAEFEESKQHNPLWAEYLLLRRLRNTLAHGTVAKDGRVTRALANEAALRHTIETLITTLLPGD